MSNSDDEFDLFRKSMSDVNRRHDKYSIKVIHKKKKPSPETIRNKPQDKFIRLQSNNHSGILEDDTYSGETVTFARGGIQNKVLKRLKRGEISFQSVLDLHGFRRAEAEMELESFLGDSITNKENCILIIHGKGYRSANGKGVLKPLTINFLKQVGQVLAFTSALPKDGGTGAVYVLLSNQSS